MNIVVDTSVIIAVITNEKHKKRLIQITKNRDLIAPSSLHWEIGNAISAIVKRNRITLAQAKVAIGYYLQIPIRYVDVKLESAIGICMKENIYAYDAYFIECALMQKAPLLSLDNKLIEIAKILGIKIIEVTS